MGEAGGYTIKETAERTGLTTDTIRYYERIGLLPRAERKDNRHRVYYAEDIRTMKLIACLKLTSIPLEDMKPFLALSPEDIPGDHPELYELLRRHRRKIKDQIASLQQILDFIDDKLEDPRPRLPLSDGEECTLSEDKARLSKPGGLFAIADPSRS